MFKLKLNATDEIVDSIKYISQIWLKYYYHGDP